MTLHHMTFKPVMLEGHVGMHRTGCSGGVRPAHAARHGPESVVLLFLLLLKHAVCRL